MKERSRPSRSAAERVGRNIRALREQQGLTLADLSARLDRLDYPMTINTLSKIERQARTIDVDDLEVISTALDVSPDYLLGDPDERTAMLRALRIHIAWGEQVEALALHHHAAREAAFEMADLLKAMVNEVDADPKHSDLLDEMKADPLTGLAERLITWEV
jgi:transcriptional regulator with XRE-family HTH domain